MQPENLNLDSYEMFKESDGYINITMLDEQVMKSLLEKSMDLTGHSLYATNRTKGDGKVTLTFVTHARAAELKEQHLYSCRNSLGGIIPESLREIQVAVGTLMLSNDSFKLLGSEGVAEFQDTIRSQSSPESVSKLAQRLRQNAACAMPYRTITVPFDQETPQ